MIPNNRQAQFKPVYYLQRPESPKNNVGHIQSAKNLSLTMSIGANQTPYNLAPFPKPKQESIPHSSNDTNVANVNDKF